MAAVRMTKRSVRVELNILQQLVEEYHRMSLEEVRTEYRKRFRSFADQVEGRGEDTRERMIYDMSIQDIISAKVRLGV